MRRSIGIQSVFPCLVLMWLTTSRILATYSMYSSTSWRDGCSSAKNVMSSWNSGWRSRKMSKALKPRSVFFERSVRSTRTIRCWRRRRSIGPSSASTSGLRASSSNIGALTEIG